MYRKLTKKCLCLLALLLTLTEMASGQIFVDAFTHETLAFKSPQEEVDYTVQTLQHCPTAQDSLDLLESISRAHYSKDSTYKYAEMELALAKRLNDKRKQASALRYIAWAQYYSDEYMKCCESTYETISLSEEIGDSASLAASYNMMANAVSSMRDESVARMYYNKALEIYKQRGADAEVAEMYRNLAHAAIDEHEYTKAKELIDKAMEHNALGNDSVGIADDLFYYGYIEQHIARMSEDPKHILSALEYMHKALDIAQREGDLLSTIRIQHSIVTIWTIALSRQSYTDKMAVVDSCRKASKSERKLSTMLGFESERIRSLITEAEFLTQAGYLTEAERKVKIVENELRGMPELHYRYVDVFEVEMNLHRRRGELDLALQAADSVMLWITKNETERIAEISSQNIAQANYNNSIQKMAHTEREQTLLFEAERRQQRALSIALLVGLAAFLCMLSVVVRNSYKRHKINNLLDKANSELEQQRNRTQSLNAELESQRVELAEQNKRIGRVNENIAAGMRYAQLIQAAAFPTMHMLQDIFGDCMVLFKSINIVSGDFLWASRVGRLKLVAVSDCTGRGVPGAFLSMMGISMLNDISSSYADEDNVSASKMLDTLRANLRAVLRQRDETTRDGMDIALLVVDEERGRVQFAGARRNLVMVRGGVATRITGDRMPIGSYFIEKDHFTQKDIETMPGDSFYIFTDGVTDQFGYEADGRLKKFNAKRLREHLARVAHLPFKEQIRRLVDVRTEWMAPKGGAAHAATQTDDSLLIGIRIGEAAPTTWQPAARLTDFIRST